jgi:hypothetical protein
MYMYIDEQGFLYYGDFRLPMKVNYDTGCLEFFDKDRWRSLERGTPFVQVPLACFTLMDEVPPIERLRDEILRG